MTRDLSFDFTGQRVLVTGCRRGIGRAVAVGFARAGADVVGVSQNLEDDDSVATEIGELGREFVGVRCDLSRRADVYRMLEEISGTQIDILVNNAGTITRTPAVDHSDEEWDRVLGLNLTAPFVLARELGRAMVERGAGKIVFVASLLTFQGGILVPSYTASKSGVGGLVRALSNEWAGHGVQVNGVAPGYIETDNTAGLLADEARREAITARIPAGRWGTPEDLVGPTLFLASSLADYVTGEVLVVDGGWMAR